MAPDEALFLLSPRGVCVEKFYTFFLRKLAGRCKSPHQKELGSVENIDSQM